MMLTENQKQWSNIISEELHVTDQNKLAWMSQYAQVHSVYEGVQPNTAVANGIYSTPLNTLGMGNPMMPMGVAGTDGFNANGVHGAGIGNTGADFHNVNYKNGSGDIPMSTLTMALEVAAMTIGLELVPVIPATGPWAMLSYMDFPYAGGKLGKLNETTFDGKGPGDENKPIYIKFNLDSADIAAAKPSLIQGTSKIKIDTANSAATGGVLKGRFMGFSRIDNNMIIEVIDATNKNVEGEDKNVSIATVFGQAIHEIKADYAGAESFAADISTNTKGKTIRPELVTGAADHIQNFSNFHKSDDPMTRAENETGTGNTIGARMFTKMVQMGAYEVTGSVTRQQLQDMPLYGVDVIGKVLEAMQNELSQAINNRILDRVFKLGVTNAKVQKDYQGVDLNLFLGDAKTPSKKLSEFSAASKYVGIDNINYATGKDAKGQPVKGLDWGTIPNAIQNTAAENITTHQRRIMSRLLAAANLIAVVSRRGRASWAVTNTQILSALQDASAFVVAPMVNTLVQDGSSSLYFAGSIAGLNLYVDPYMSWDDTRICVGRKSDGKTPGVVFMPYILADTVQTVVEGTMAPKLLVNSRFAIVDAGFYPEQNYYTFMVDTANGAYLL